MTRLDFKLVELNNARSALCLLLLVSVGAFAQGNKSVVIGTMVDRPHAIVVINPPNGNQGFLVPQITTTQRLSILPSSPEEDGLLIYDTTDKCFYFWKDNKWVKGLGDDAAPVLAYDPVTYKLKFGTSNEVDLNNLKEVPTIAGNAGKFLTTDGTSISWSTPTVSPGSIDLTLTGQVLNLTSDLTSVDLSSLLWGGPNITDGSITGVDLANGTIATSKLAAGALNTVLTTTGTGTVTWTTPAVSPDAQDLSMAGNVLSLSNDATPVNLSSLSLNGGNIVDGSINGLDLANNAVGAAKLTPGSNNTVLTTNGAGIVTWAAPPVSPDAQDLTIAGNVLNLTNDATPINLNTLTANGQVTGPLNTLTIAPNSITNGQIQNASITPNKLVSAGVPDANKIYATDAAGTPQLELKSALFSGVSASGDLSGTFPAPNVAKIQGNAVSSAPLTIVDAGKLLVWNGTQWVAQSVAGASPLSQYVMIDPSDFTNLRRSDKKDKDNIIVFDDNSAYVTTIKKDEGPQIIAPLHLPQGATIEQVTLYYMDREPNNIVFNVFRKIPTGGNQNIINTWTSTGNSGAIQTSVHNPIVGNEVIDNNTYSYRIVINLDQTTDVNDSNDANLRVYAVKIKYLP